MYKPIKTNTRVRDVFMFWYKEKIAAVCMLDYQAYGYVDIRALSYYDGITKYSIANLLRKCKEQGMTPR